MWTSSADIMKMKARKVRGTGAVALFDVLRQRADPAAEVEGREDDPQQDQAEGGHPLEVTDHQPVFVSGRSQAHEVDRGDVCAEQAGPDQRPAERAAGEEELVGGCVLPVAGQDADGHDAQQVADDDDRVDYGDGPVSHASLLSAWKLPVVDRFCGLSVLLGIRKQAGQQLRR